MAAWWERGRKPAPPLRRCDDCGGDFYGWAGVLCRVCLKRRRSEPQVESLRAFRQRVLEGGPSSSGGESE